MAFKEFTIPEFQKYINSIQLTRAIKWIQLHHTYSPSYKHFNGKNHQTLQQNMKTYHTKTNGWSDIGQNLTIFPDGVIMLGRPLNVAPAGIKGANSSGICIECVGNFDIGEDVMTELQKETIVAVTKILLDKFNLNASDNVTYHCWWGADGREIGDYYKGVSTKTCPGTNFFGGNGLTAYRNNLQPLIENYGVEEEVENIIYNSIDEVPEWGKNTISKLVGKGLLIGNNEGNLNISMDMLRVFVVNDRAKLYD